jgi:hypothetical protein
MTARRTDAFVVAVCATRRRVKTIPGTNLRSPTLAPFASGEVPIYDSQCSKERYASGKRHAHERANDTDLDDDSKSAKQLPFIVTHSSLPFKVFKQLTKNRDYS